MAMAMAMAIATELFKSHSSPIGIQGENPGASLSESDSFFLKYIFVL